MNEFLKGLELFNKQEVNLFTPEYRVYYNEEGDVLSVYVTEKDKKAPEGMYLVITDQEYRHLRPSAKIKDKKLVYPKKNKIFNLIKSNKGFGTIKNNLYFVGTDEYYEQKKEY